MMNNGREWAAVFIASVIVISYISIGFMSAIIEATTGTVIKFPPDWQSAMLSLVSTAFGFLIAKFTTSQNGNLGTGLIPESGSLTITTEQTPPPTAKTPVATQPFVRPTPPLPK